jgi:hypothetical protein
MRSGQRKAMRLASTTGAFGGGQSRTSTLPRVMAAATMKVPASMRSGMMACSMG